MRLKERSRPSPARSFPCYPYLVLNQVSSETFLDPAASTPCMLVPLCVGCQFDCLPAFPVLVVRKLLRQKNIKQLTKNFQNSKVPVFQSSGLTFKNYFGLPYTDSMKLDFLEKFQSSRIPEFWADIWNVDILIRYFHSHSGSGPVITQARQNWTRSRTSDNLVIF